MLFQESATVSEDEYEARTDLGRTYSCYKCALPVQESEKRLKLLTIVYKQVFSEFRSRRVETATAHVRLLDSKSDGRDTDDLLNAELLSLYTMMKRMAILSILNDAFAMTQKELNERTVTRNACLHRYEKTVPINTVRISRGSMIITDDYPGGFCDG